MENNTVYVNTVYEGFRPFLTTNAHSKWPSNKMAFYRSIGQSMGHNEWEANFRKNCWFPCLGIMEDKTTFQRLLKHDKYYPKIWIIKSVPNVIFKIHKKWYDVILKHMDYSPLDKKPEWSILPFLKREMIDDNLIYLVMDNVRKCVSALHDYCDFWWQVQTSAQLGGGLWEIVPIFRKYVLSYHFDDYSSHKHISYGLREKPLEELKIVFNVPEKTNNTEKEVNVDLKSQGALIDLLIYQDFRPYIKQLKHIFNYGAKSKTQILELKKTKSKTNNKRKSTKKKSTRKRV